MNEIKKNDLIKARKLCNFFRFIDNLNSINDGGNLETSYSNICPEELEQGNISFLLLSVAIDLQIRR